MVYQHPHGHAVQDISLHATHFVSAATTERKYAHHIANRDDCTAHAEVNSTQMWLRHLLQDCSMLDRTQEQLCLHEKSL